MDHFFAIVNPVRDLLFFVTF